MSGTRLRGQALAHGSGDRRSGPQRPEVGGPGRPVAPIGQTTWDRQLGTGAAPARTGPAGRSRRPWPGQAAVSGHGVRGQAPVERGQASGGRDRRRCRGTGLGYRERSDARDARGGTPGDRRQGTGARRARTGRGVESAAPGVWLVRLADARAPVVPIGGKITILLDSHVVSVDWKIADKTLFRGEIP